MSISLIFLLLALGWCNPAFASKPEPLRVLWSDKTYGPNGPWYALSIQIGSPPRNVDLFPSNIGATWIPNQHFCSKQPFPQSPLSLDPKCSEHTSIWNTTESQSVHKPRVGNASAIPSFAYPLRLRAEGSYVLDTIAIGDSQHKAPNVAIYSVNSGSYLFSEMSFGGIFNVGVLGLLGQGLELPNLQAYLPLNYLLKTNGIPSLSYGLHIGSVRAKILPSLYLGGYDQTRALGPMVEGHIPPPPVYQHTKTPQPRYLFVTLKDININTAGAHLPKGLPSPGHSLLSTDGTSKSISPVEVGIQPDTPYMHLPTSVCQNFEKFLPIKFDPKTSLYLWETSDSRYLDILHSNSYADFTIQSELSNSSISIRIPWKLFDLELDSPLVSKSTRYFPCVNTDGAFSDFMLGRAFLQSTFLAINWHTGSEYSYFYIAQAPGPNITKTPSVQTISNQRTPPKGDYNVTWESTWGFPEPVNQPSPGHNSHDLPGSASGLSDGGKIAIGVSLGLVLPSLLCLAIFVFMSRRRAKQNADAKSHYKATAAEMPGSFHWLRRFIFYGGLHEAAGNPIHEAPASAAVGDAENPAEAEAEEVAVEAFGVEVKYPVELSATPLYYTPTDSQSPSTESPHISIVSDESSGSPTVLDETPNSPYELYCSYIAHMNSTAAASHT